MLTSINLFAQSEWLEKNTSKTCNLFEICALWKVGLVY